MTLFQKAVRYAKKCHEETNHQYDGQSYIVHLAMVVSVAAGYVSLLRQDHKDIVYAACWAHDVIEDTRQTYNDVKAELGKEVADIVYACTNEKGRNRKERASEKFYAELKANPLAVFVKLCDRIANMEYSKEHNGEMLIKYAQEAGEFERALYMDTYEPMFGRIRSMAATINPPA